MKAVTVFACAFALSAGLLGSGQSALAQSGSAEFSSGAPDIATFAGITLDQAVSMVERQFKARVVRADTQRNGDRTIYVLRLLNSAGRVWTVRVDAQSGQVE